MGDTNLPNEKLIEESMAELSTGLADNFGAMAELLTRWREPPVARAVLDSMLAGDGRAFHKLLGFDPGRPLPDPLPPDFCTIVFELAEKLVPERKERVCRLRTDLSKQEVRLYIAIARRCNLVLEEFTVHGAPGPVVPEGPCLQMLIEAGLVTCQWEPVQGIAIRFGPPTRVCF
jgi:hypothetical protein